MKVQSLNFNINFQKRLIARAAYKKDEVSEPCRIYELEREYDWDYFENPSMRAWRRANYLEDVKSEWLHPTYENEAFYVTEDNMGNCLAIALVGEPKDTDYNTLAFIEVCPSNSKHNPYRKTKYIGETLLATLCAKTQSDGKDFFSITCPTISAYEFYSKNCKFEADSSLGLHMKKENFSSFYEQNEKHTGKNIELIV